MIHPKKVSITKHAMSYQPLKNKVQVYKFLLFINQKLKRTNLTLKNKKTLKLEVNLKETFEQIKKNKSNLRNIYIMKSGRFVTKNK